MALTVEDNTGLADADSYVTVQAFRDYAAARGIVEVADLTDEDAEQKLRLGFDYINSNWAYKSTPKTNDQAGEFPRVGLSDGAGRTFDTVPPRVKQAQFAAAIAALSGALFATADRGGRVKSEAIGPISVTYEDGAPVGRVFEEVARLLAPFVKSDAEPRQPVPYFNAPTTDPLFRVGMDDTPGMGDYA